MKSRLQERVALEFFATCFLYVVVVTFTGWGPATVAGLCFLVGFFVGRMSNVAG